MIYLPCPFKVCKHCKSALLPNHSFFYRKNGNLDSWCKQCRNQKNKEYADKHPEVTKRAKQNYLERHPDRRKESVVKYREANRDICQQRSDQWRERNRKRVALNAVRRYWKCPEKFRQRSRQYHQQNPDVGKAQRKRYWSSERGRIVARKHQHIRKARLKQAEGYYSVEDIHKQYKRQKGKCYYCHKDVGDKYHIEHVVPLSRGGSNWPENIVIACPHCNDSKNNRLPHEWPEGGRLL